MTAIWLQLLSEISGCRALASRASGVGSNITSVKNALLARHTCVQKNWPEVRRHSNCLAPWVNRIGIAEVLATSTVLKFTIGNLEEALTLLRTDSTPSEVKTKGMLRS
eukprot:4829138-Amphidinium_carterae.1